MNELVGGDGASLRPLPDRGNFFGAGDAERASGVDFGEQDFRVQLLFGGESGVQSGGDRLLDFGARETFAGCCQPCYVKRGRIAAASTAII